MNLKKDATGEMGTSVVVGKINALIVEMNKLIPEKDPIKKKCSDITKKLKDYEKLTDDWANDNTAMAENSVVLDELAGNVQDAFKRIVATTIENIAKETIYYDKTEKILLSEAPAEIATLKEPVEHPTAFTAARLAARQMQNGEIIEQVGRVRRLSIEMASKTDMSEMNTVMEEVDREFKIANDLIDAAMARFRTGSNSQNAKIGQDNFKLWEEALTNFKNLAVHQIELVQKMNVLAKEIGALNKEIGKYAEQKANGASHEVSNAYSYGTYTAIVMTIIALAIGVTLGIGLTRNIAGATSRVTDVLHLLVNDGDITVQIDPKLIVRGDEIGRLANLTEQVLSDYHHVSDLALSLSKGDWTVQSSEKSEKDTMNKNLNAMIDKINNALQAVASSVGKVNSGAAQIASASDALSHGATESAASIEEISASMSELANQTNQNAQSAGEAAQLAMQTNTSGAEGQKMMNNMVNSMELITKNSAEVQKVIRVIDDISFQTNLLALNAAVEAARAGQHGKGFAVVAEEVRNLAARCAKAAGETTQMIEGNNKQIGQGAEIATQMAEMLNSIVGHAAKTAEIIKKIATASTDQAHGITQVNQGLHQIEAVTQQNTASAEETASVSNEMSAQARELRQLVDFFQLKS